MTQLRIKPSRRTL